MWQCVAKLTICGCSLALYIAETKITEKMRVLTGIDTTEIEITEMMQLLAGIVHR